MEGKLIPLLVEQARISNKVAFSDSLPSLHRFTSSFHSLSKINRLIVSDVPLIGEVIFLSKGRHLPRDNKREREGIGVHHRILPSKDAGPLAFNADASFPLIPPQRDDHDPFEARNRLSSVTSLSLSLSLPCLSTQDPVVAQKDYPFLFSGLFASFKGITRWLVVSSRWQPRVGQGKY